MVLTGLRVLVVEDEAMLSILLEDFLSDLGCEVVATASHLEDAVEKARNLAIDVAVLDINLGGQLSYPVAEALRSRAIPFLFATGYGTLGLPEELLGTLVLSKPFNQRQLATAIRSTQIGHA